MLEKFAKLKSKVTDVIVQSGTIDHLDDLRAWKEHERLKKIRAKLDIELLETKTKLATVRNFLTEPNLNASARVDRIKKFLGIEKSSRFSENKQVD